jgi:hypothetical protein
MKKVLGLLMAGALISAFMVGCGNNATDEGTPKPDVAAPTGEDKMGGEPKADEQKAGDEAKTGSEPKADEAKDAAPDAGKK